MELSDLHPLTTHFPIAFLTLASILCGVSIFRKSDFLSKSLLLILILGVVSSVLTLFTGNLAATEFSSAIAPRLDAFISSEINSLIEQHEDFATYTMLNYTFMLIILFYEFINKRRNKQPIGAALRIVILGLTSLTGLYLIYKTGIYGGELVFRYGVGSWVP
ncbi:MAG: hypothetical protein HUU54_00135 [Ignavibacteriaceae bacterium]|nr:hypothetical protein [Ignavibacteriaceae bacterium]